MRRFINKQTGEELDHIQMLVQFVQVYDGKSAAEYCKFYQEVAPK